MFQSNSSNVLELLKTGRHRELIGVPETRWLECKKQLFDLSRDDQKIEFAKDVSALANAGGGLLVFGLTTKRSDTEHADVISDISLIPLSRINGNQMKQVLGTWLFPPLEDLSIQVIRAPDDPERGMVVVHIPPPGREELPVMVRRALADDGQVVGSMLGVYERRTESAYAWSPERIHSLLGTGIRFDERIADELRSLRTLVEERTVARAATLDDEKEQLEDSRRRIDAAVSAAGLDQQPVFWLMARPRSDLELDGLFKGRDAPLVRLLDSPPQLRPAGFDLDLETRTEIVGGQMRRALAIDFGVLELHRDGLLLFVVRGDGHGLCWGRMHRQQENLLINQLALFERTLLFCDAMVKLYSMSGISGVDATLRLGVMRMSRNENSVILEAGALSDWPSHHTKKASASDGSVEITFTIGGKSPERLAADILAEFYAWFGLDHDAIPYRVEREGGDYIVDRDVIAAGGK